MKLTGNCGVAPATQRDILVSETPIYTLYLLPIVNDDDNWITSWQAVIQMFLVT